MFEDSLGGDKVIDPTLPAIAIYTSDFVAIDRQHEPELRVKEQAEGPKPDQELFSPVQSACLENVVLDGSINEKEAVYRNTSKDEIDDLSGENSLETSLMPNLDTDSIAATVLSSTKLNGRGRKRRRLHEDNVVDRVPRKRLLRSSTVPSDSNKSRRLKGDFINMNDHVERLRSKISEALETLHQVWIAANSKDSKHLLNFSHSWKLHYTNKHTSQISPKTLRTLRKNFDKVLQLPDMFPNNTSIKQSCLELDEAFTQYDSLHLHLISGLRPRSMRVAKV